MSDLEQATPDLAVHQGHDVHNAVFYFRESETTLKEGPIAVVSAFVEGYLYVMHELTGDHRSVHIVNNKGRVLDTITSRKLTLPN